MKKLLLMFALVFALVSCQCSGNGGNEPALNGVQPVLGGIQVENVNKTDFETMFAKYGQADLFRWYECEILLNDFLDEEGEGGIAELVNIFQVVNAIDSTSFDTYVYKIQHFPNSKVLTDSVNGFWIQNEPITLDEIKVPYDSACAIVAAVNYPKPHSRHVTLRKPLGPVPCNTQWIFGNIREQIWIDAVTGEARKSNPAFPEEKGFKMPLGEWP